MIISNIKRIIKTNRHKDKSIVVLDSWFGSKFADNPRFLFQYLDENKKSLGLKRVVWVTRNKKLYKTLSDMGYEVYMLGSSESIDIHQRAYYQICNNAPTSNDNFKGELDADFSYFSKRINLWHGTGAIKTFNMASNKYLSKETKHPVLYKIKNFLYSYIPIFRKIYGEIGGWADCYFLTTSESEMIKFKKCYRLPNNRFIISGYPRDSFESVKLLPEEQTILNIVAKYKCTIMYLPTFRDKNSKFNFLEVAKYLQPILKKNDILFIQKAHSAERNFTNYKLESNLLSLPSDFDINVLTKKVTFILTDYSSIIADALYHYKPILLFVPDYEEYMHGERGFSEDAEFILSAGKKFYTLKELKDYIDNYYLTPEAAKTENYYQVRKKIWESKKTMEEIWKDITEQIK